MSRTDAQYELLDTGHGRQVRIGRFLPAGNAKAVVLIAGAMGVAQRYYAPLAGWLAGRGFAVVTFDYFGTGLSRFAPLREVDVDIFDWVRDCDAIIRAAQQLVPTAPLYWIGHSLGGQILGLIDRPERIAKAVTVACGSGYWRENTPQLKRRVWWVWFVVVPLVMPIAGYFPGKRLRKVGDLPRRVMAQWRRWCLNPEYSVGVEGPAARASYAAVAVPITSLSFTDDEMMSARNVESLHSFYSGAPKRMRRIAPADVGTPRIGHFGFFNDRFESSLWPDYLLPELT